MVCGAALDPSGQTLVVIFPVCTHVPRLFHFISLPSNTCRATHSWWLASAPSECHIEFSAASISDEEMALLEQDANEAIRAAHPMHIRHYDDAPACAFASKPLLCQVQSRTISLLYFLANHFLF